MEKIEIAKKIDELDRKFSNYMNKIKEDNVMSTLFPLEVAKLSTNISDHPTPPIEKYYSNKHSVLEWLAFYEEFQKNLNKEVRAEKHDHHGLHLLIEEIIVLIKQLL